MAIKSDIQRNPSSFRRAVAKIPEAILKNRFVEENQALNDSPFSYITRPALKKWIEVGEGHIRKVFSEPGVFGDDLFVVSETFLYRVNSLTQTATLIGQLGSSPLGSVSMAATAPIGDVPAYLYIAEGGVLWCYAEEGPAFAHLSISGVISNGETVEIEDVYYQFVSGSVDTGTPAGTVGNPWLVKIEANIPDTLYNLYLAINGVGSPGVNYSTGLTAHTLVKATSSTGTDLYARAIVRGALGNVYSTTETLANGSWGAATFENGGEEVLYQIDTPDNNGAIAVAHINSYVIVVPVQLEEQATNGRFYWIEPGENEIDPLNFATAERSPDKLHQVVVFSDMFWLLGEKTTEPWITTGDAAAPMQRYRSVLFDRGSWEGTAIQVKDSLIVADQDGGVFQIKGGLKRISTPQIEERIRKAIQIEKTFFP